MSGPKRVLQLFLEAPWYFRVAALSLLGSIVVALFLATAEGGWIGRSSQTSLMDRLIGFRLKQSAEGYERNGQMADAIDAWQRAIIVDPDDRASYRGAVRAMISAMRSGGHKDITTCALDQKIYLKELGGSLDDLVLLASFYRECRQFPEVVYLLKGHYSGLSPAASKLMVEALLFTGDLERFLAVWNRYSANLTNDPSMLLTRAAWAELAGPGASVAPARKALDEARGNPELSAYAEDLQSFVSCQLFGVHFYQIAPLDEIQKARFQMKADDLRQAGGSCCIVDDEIELPPARCWSFFFPGFRAEPITPRKWPFP